VTSSDLLYVVAAVVAIAVAAWLQFGTSMVRGYAWLSRAGALVFALLSVSTVLASPNVPTISQAVILACLPLIAVPYQVRMMRFIERARRPQPQDVPARGPGGGRVRSRGRGRR
jgi:drug/metabolite transporter (DMT)-like permease